MKVNDSKYEALSALIDGESDNIEGVLKQVSENADLKARWEEHYRTKAAMHGEFTPALGGGFADRVSAAIESEPAILAPRASMPKRNSPEPSWRKPLAGLAIAATVAAVSVFGLNSLSTSDVEPVGDIVASTPVTLDPTTNPIVQPTVEVRRVSLSGENGTYWAVQQADKNRDAKLEARLNMYLADHMEYANSSKVQGMLPYSRLVGYDTTE